MAVPRRPSRPRHPRPHGVAPPVASRACSLRAACPPAAPSGTTGWPGPRSRLGPGRAAPVHGPRGRSASRPARPGVARAGRGCEPRPSRAATRRSVWALRVWWGRAGMKFAAGGRSSWCRGAGLRGVGYLTRAAGERTRLSGMRGRSAGGAAGRLPRRTRSHRRSDGHDPLVDLEPGALPAILLPYLVVTQRPPAKAVALRCCSVDRSGLQVVADCRGTGSKKPSGRIDMVRH